jgi:hypothetical protein
MRPQGGGQVALIMDNSTPLDSQTMCINQPPAISSSLGSCP